MSTNEHADAEAQQYYDPPKEADRDVAERGDSTDEESLKQDVLAQNDLDPALNLKMHLVNNVGGPSSRCVMPSSH
jgi:hypothetical protein